MPTELDSSITWTYYGRMLTSSRAFGVPYTVLDFDTDRMFMMTVQGLMFMMPNNWILA